MWQVRVPWEAQEKVYAFPFLYTIPNLFAVSWMVLVWKVHSQRTGCCDHCLLIELRIWWEEFLEICMSLFCRQLECKGQEKEHHWYWPSETPQGCLPQIQVSCSVSSFTKVCRARRERGILSNSQQAACSWLMLLLFCILWMHSYTVITVLLLVPTMLTKTGQNRKSENNTNLHLRQIVHFKPNSGDVKIRPLMCCLILCFLTHNETHWSCSPMMP